MIVIINHIAKFGFVYSEGNKFAQALNDCANLKNRHKWMTLGLKMVGPQLKHIFCAFLGMILIKDGNDKAGQNKINKIYE